MVFKQKIKVLSKTDFTIKGVLEFMCCDDKQCLPPTEVEFAFNIKGNPESTEEVRSQMSEVRKDTNVVNADSASVKPEAKPVVFEQQAEEKSSFLWFFLISFLAGLAAIITPCVFPMIPMTVTFFMKGSENKRKAKMQALVYGLSIIVIYTVIGTIVAVTLGANFANFLSTHWLPNIFFFLIIFVFAASFLGMFEITLPAGS